jgi:hypothetical protein
MRSYFCNQCHLQSTTAEFVWDVRIDKFSISYPGPIASKDILVFITLGIPHAV